jgi:DNA-binding MarR family transcriptional regulator
MAGGSARVSDFPAPDRSLGDLLQDFVSRVAHRSGKTLTIMDDASVTLQQVILLNRLKELGGATMSEVALALGMSLTSVSQMISRLHRLGFVSRMEVLTDRRRRHVDLTVAGGALLHRLNEARSIEFDMGTAPLSATLRAELAQRLSHALRELEACCGQPAESDATPQAAPRAVRSR